MNARFVVLGVVFMALGVAFILYPGVLITPTHAFDRSYVVLISPDSYSNVNKSLGPQQTLTVTIQSSPYPVDFFLMNTTSFSTWNSRGNPPSEVYPQWSKSNVTDYTFSVGGIGAARNYTLVFISLSPTTSTDVEVTVVVDNPQSFLQENSIPLVLLVCGVALAAFGATRGGGKKPLPPPEEQEEQTGGLGEGLLSGLLGGGSSSAPVAERRCRRCGAPLEEGAMFCPVCNTSQA